MPNVHVRHALISDAVHRSGEEKKRSVSVNVVLLFSAHSTYPNCIFIHSVLPIHFLQCLDHDQCISVTSVEIQYVVSELVEFECTSLKSFAIVSCNCYCYTATTVPNTSVLQVVLVCCNQCAMNYSVQCPHRHQWSRSRHQLPGWCCTTPAILECARGI